MLELIVPIHWQQTKKKRVMVGLNFYRNAHFQILNKVKKEYHELLTAQIKRKYKYKESGKVHIHYRIYLKRKGSDGGNARSVVEKFVLDSLIENKVIEDDNAEVVISDSSEYFFDKENPRAEIKVRWL